MIIYDKEGNEIRCELSQLEQMLEAGYTDKAPKPKIVKQSKVVKEEVKEPVVENKKTTKTKKDIIL